MKKEAISLDGDFEIDVKQLLDAVRDAEVVSIFFPLVRKSLIIDTRFNAEDEPMVRVVPQVGSLEERYRNIRRTRPQFPRPEKITAIPWPKYVNSLVQTGVFALIRGRLEQSGFQGPLHALDLALEELHRLEKLELAAVIKGEHYHTLWPRRE